MSQALKRKVGKESNPLRKDFDQGKRDDWDHRKRLCTALVSKKVIVKNGEKPRRKDWTFIYARKRRNKGGPKMKILGGT